MTTRRLLVAGAAVAITAAALLFGGIAARSSAPAIPAASPAAGKLIAGFAAGDTASFVARLQAGLQADPANVHGLGLLGLAYQQRARETGDPSYYTLSAAALRRALKLAPRDVNATSGLASLELSRHRFATALALGRRALALSPTTARNYGIVGDALLELGRYREAFDTFDTMARLRPSVSSYARIAYARELQGNLGGARQALLLARDAAADEQEPYAWTETQLAKLELGRGRLRAAETHLRGALQVFPGYVYALDVLAQVDLARGRLEKATALEARAVARIPLPQFVGLYGDLLRATGHPQAARLQYATEDGIRRLLNANGVRTDLETALFDIDHGIRLRESLELARRAQRARPSIDGDDVLAWALARNGRCGEALRYSRLALRLGTRDAAKLFHRAYIERCLGGDPRPWARRALELNPHFSALWTSTLRRLAS